MSSIVIILALCVFYFSPDDTLCFFSASGLAMEFPLVLPPIHNVTMSLTFAIFFFVYSGSPRQLGVFEGYTSAMSLDGSQPMSVGLRHDCISETSASFAVRSLTRRSTNATAAASDRSVAM